jgi:carboxybiotin decarboxylase
MGGFFEFLEHGLTQFFRYTAFANMTTGHVVMIIVGLIFIYLAITKEYEPLLLVPIGFGILIGNIPFLQEANLTARRLRTRKCDELPLLRSN